MGKFDSLSLPVDQPARMTLLHPVTRQPLCDADGREAYIDLFGPDSAAVQQCQRTQQKRRLDRGHVRRLQLPTPEEIEENHVEVLAAMTAGWYLVGLDGAPLDVEHSDANARELYAARGLAWIREQANEFASDRANFARASSSS